jgi:hypothetical protein
MFTNTIVLIVLNGIFIKNTGFLEITGTQKMFVTYFYLFYLHLIPIPIAYLKKWKLFLYKDMKSMSS